MFKAWWNSDYFFPRKIHLHNFFPLFLADGREVFVLFRGGGVYSVVAPKSQIWALNRGWGCLVGGGVRYE